MGGWGGEGGGKDGGETHLKKLEENKMNPAENTGGSVRRSGRSSMLLLGLFKTAAGLTASWLQV